jgi:hypothetical protein
MKHAREAALDALEPILGELRALVGMVEKQRGVFYRGSRAFLHFHEDPAGFFADVRVPADKTARAHPSGDDDWQRLRVNSLKERRALVALVRRALA